MTQSLKFIKSNNFKPPSKKEQFEICGTYNKIYIIYWERKLDGDKMYLSRFNKLITSEGAHRDTWGGWFPNRETAQKALNLYKETHNE